MFILGFQFPASMGNDVAKEEVIKKLDSAVNMSGVSKITLTYGKQFENKVEYSNMSTFLGKALVHYFQDENPEKAVKYVIYTNRYQISEISKVVDTDDESKKLCRLLDSMEQFRISVA